MPGLYLPFAQRLFSDHDAVGRVAQRDLCDRVGFDDLQEPRSHRSYTSRRCATCVTVTVLVVLSIV
jgi:hypothetical protein